MMNACHLSARWLLAVAVLLTLTTGACAAPRLEPVINEEHLVTPISDPAKIVTVLEPMVWTNAPADEATKGIRLPAGTYVLEAEDAEYLYFKAPAPIGVKAVQAGEPPDQREIPGGLAIAKAFNLVPAATYVVVGPTLETRTLIFKHGAEFLEVRDKQWTRSF